MDPAAIIPNDNIALAANIPLQKLPEKYDLLVEQHVEIQYLFQIAKDQNLSLQKNLVKNADLEKKINETIENSLPLESKKYSLLEAKIAMLENQLNENKASAEAVIQSSCDTIF